ncbi:hypothetical protein PHLCEN_2v7427 [Hermanssonia centrifuga]|uniref:Major facilitator superfamily (MFS) profile domain-containing protein n=1 Tax=Hermanssonia centrifuga TaxID=98765 RepID=A0A2R6NWH9_9APHY|nr:hypothetical protein PHLCEN_2v7427 [Hermanssonia centrifuga]
MSASGTILGRILPGILGNRIGIFNLIIIYTALGGAVIFTMSKATETSGLIAFAAVYGPCGGVLQSLFPALVASYNDGVTASEYGLRLGFGFLVYGIGCLVGGPINGALLNPPSYDWEASIVFSGVMIWAGCVALIASRRILAVRKGSWRV